jgi:hypothetical protein
MARTTLDIDTPLLKELKRLQRTEKKSLGRLVSELVAQGLVVHRRRARAIPAFAWVSQDMKAKVDLADRDAIYDALEAGQE